MNNYKYLRDTFLKYHMKIFPIKNGTKEPLINSWQVNASDDKKQILYWLEHGQNPNWALPAAVNNLFIIDVDMHNGVDGISSWNKLIEDLGVDKVVDTIYQKTPSGGIHFIFESDEELSNVKNKANFFKEYPGIDVRTKGYVLVAPSSINGVEYVLSGTMDGVGKMPQALKDYILNISNEEIKNIKKRIGFERQELVEKGGRDDEIFSYINYLYDKTSLSYDEILTLALDYNYKSFRPELSDKVVEYKVKKAFEKTRDKIIVIKISEGAVENE